MTDTGPAAASHVTIRNRGFAWIWLAPIVALGIVIWLGWQHYHNQGPTIQISFQRADGLEAGRTQIKHKSVPIGVVTRIGLSDDLTHVVVTATMDRSVEDYLGQNTQFWVVRPRFNSGNISGLDTLVSGSYIAVQPSQGEGVSEFRGLENPPVTLNDVPGQHFTLHSDILAALDEGSTIFFRGADAGAVQGYRLNEKGDGLDIYIFIRDPYAKFVNADTRFWNASGVEVNTTVNGLELKTESFRALLSGGVGFDTPVDNTGGPVPDNKIFRLYESKRASDADPRAEHYYYTINFPGQVHSLNVRSPVELNGYRIGRVTEIGQEIFADQGSVKTPVIVEIETDRLWPLGAKPKKGLTGQAAVNYALDQMIRKGLRAQLASASLLTGQRFPQLTFRPEASAAKLIMGGKNPEIPAVEAGTLDDATRSATTLLQHVDKVVGNADHLITNLGDLTGKDQLQNTVKSLDSTVKDLDRVLNNVDTDLRPLGNQLPHVLEELRYAARSVRSLVDFVDQHPESLLLGRKEETLNRTDNVKDENNQ